jgi:DNA-binding SARP family transcriptional activator
MSVPGSETLRLRVQILGPLRVWRDGREVDAGPQQQRSVLAFLAARAGNPVTVTEMIDLLWGEDPPPSAVNAVHRYVGALRRVLDPTIEARSPGRWLVRHGPGYRLGVAVENLDLAAFRHAAGAARSSVRDGDEATALERYVEALRLWQGRPGGGIADTVGAQALFASLTGEYVTVAVDAARLARRLGCPERVVELLRQAAVAAPYDEPLHAELVSAMAAAGRHADALTAYGAIRDRLASELDIEPSSVLEQAHRAVLVRNVVVPRPRPEHSSPAQLPPELPLFVGRTATMATVRRLVTNPSRVKHAPRILAFDGMPGIGKTALAIRVAHELAAGYPDGQLYLNLHGFRANSRAVTVEEALRDLISGLGVGPGSIPVGRQAMAGLYRTLLHDRRILVVLDDARDAEQLTDLLPSSRDCLAVVTSRRRMTALRTSAGADLVSVSLPDREEARTLLLEHLGGRPGVIAPVLDALIDECGRLPLALAIAGAHAAASAGPLQADTLGEFRHVMSAGVRDAFYGSYRWLGSAAARLFRLLSLGSGSEVTVPEVTVPGVAARAAIPAQEARVLLHELHQVGLLQQQHPGRYGWHRLVHAFAAELHDILDCDASPLRGPLHR